MGLAIVDRLAVLAFFRNKLFLDGNQSQTRGRISEKSRQNFSHEVIL